MTDLILLVVLIAICGAAAGYVYKAKKRGVKCIGCPSANTCSGKGKAPCNGCSCGCGTHEN